MRKLYSIIRQLCFSILMFGLASITQYTNAQLFNPGFESGDLTGWSGSEGTGVSEGMTVLSWTVNPADSFMASIEPTTSLLIETAEANLGLPAGALVASNSGLFSDATNFATLAQEITLNADDSLIIHWNFIAQDYAPFNDGVIATLIGPSYQSIRLLAVTADPFGDPEAIITGDYGSTGWLTVKFIVVEAGTYTLGFASFNTGDESVNPILIIDDGVGGTFAPGEAIVTTAEVTSVGNSSATSGGEVISDGGEEVTARGVCWNTTGLPTTSDSLTSDGTGLGLFISNLTGLSSGTLYYVRAYATNSVSTVYGPQQSFTTNSGPSSPTVTTTTESSVTQTTAASGGNVTSDGGEAVTDRGVCWNLLGSPTIEDSITSDESGTGPFTSSLTNLSVGTIYYVRAYATNSIGTGYGDEISFTTLKYPQAITFEQLSVKFYGDSVFIISATGGASGNPVTFTSSDETVATCSGANGDTIIILKVGSSDVTANQAGNSIYDDAEPVIQTLTVDPKEITITADTDQSKVYTEEDPELTYTVIPALTGEDSITGSLSREAGDSAGIYEINIGTLDAGENYSVTYVAADFEVIPKQITVTADEGQSKFPGEADTVFTYTYEPELELGDSLTGALSREAGEGVGTYAITPGDLSAGLNYEIVLISSDFIILVFGDVDRSGTIDEGEIAGDVDGDGTIGEGEAAGDLDGDGSIGEEEISGDRDGNGTIGNDETAGDVNGDGTIVEGEAAGDLNGDGSIGEEEISGDRDGNGTIGNDETAGDINGDGTIGENEITGDINGDGTIGEGETEGDVNGNGVLDGEEISGINNVITSSDIKLFPNPVFDYLDVEVAGVIFNVEIFDTKGALVFSQKDCKDYVRINLPAHVKGLILVKVNTGTISHIVRIVVQ